MSLKGNTAGIRGMGGSAGRGSGIALSGFSVAFGSGGGGGATAWEISAPSTGYSGSPISILLTPNGTWTGTPTVSDNGAVGTFGTIPSWSNSSESQTVLYTSALTKTGEVTFTVSASGLTPASAQTDYFLPSIAISPNSVLIDTTNTLVTVTGTGTEWEANTPEFVASGISGLSITSQTVLSNTSATFLLTTGASAGTGQITESVQGESAVLFVTGGSGGLTVAYYPLYLVSVVSPLVFVVGDNGPIRIQVTRLDGQNCDVPTTIAVTGTDPAGNAITTITPYLESEAANVAMFIDIEYTYLLAGEYTLTTLVEMPTGVNTGLELTIPVGS